MEAGLAIWGWGVRRPKYFTIYYRSTRPLQGNMRICQGNHREFSGKNCPTFIAINQLAVEITRRSLSFGCICINSSTCLKNGKTDGKCEYSNQWITYATCLLSNKTCITTHEYIQRVRGCADIWLFWNDKFTRNEKDYNWYGMCEQMIMVAAAPSRKGIDMLICIKQYHDISVFYLNDYILAVVCCEFLSGTTKYVLILNIFIFHF